MPNKRDIEFELRDKLIRAKAKEKTKKEVKTWFSTFVTTLKGEEPFDTFNTKF